MRVLITVVLLLSACAPVAQPAASHAPASPVAEPSAGQTLAPAPSPTPVVQPGPVLDNPFVTITSAPFPIAPTFTLTRSAVPADDFTVRWGIDRYLEGLDRYREFGDYLPARGAFGEAVAAALVESRTPGVKRTFVLESLRIEAVYKKPWGTQALADVRVTIVDRAVNGSAPDQRETGLLRLSGDKKLQVVDGWNAAAGRWFNGRVRDDAAGLRESVAQAIGLYLRRESWVMGGPVETYADGFGMTPFKTARSSYVGAFDRARTTSRMFEDVTGAIERHDTFAELPGGITTARLSATVVTTDTAGRTQRESVTRRVKVFFGNWMPEVVDEEITPGVWRSGGDLALVEIDINLA